MRSKHVSNTWRMLDLSTRLSCNHCASRKCGLRNCTGLSGRARGPGCRLYACRQTLNLQLISVLLPPVVASAPGALPATLTRQPGDERRAVGALPAMLTHAHSHAPASSSSCASQAGSLALACPRRSLTPACTPSSTLKPLYVDVPLTMEDVCGPPQAYGQCSLRILKDVVSFQTEPTQ